MDCLPDYVEWHQKSVETDVVITGLEEPEGHEPANYTTFPLTTFSGASMRVQLAAKPWGTALQLCLTAIPRESFVPTGAEKSREKSRADDPTVNPEQVAVATRHATRHYSDGKNPLGIARYEVIAGQIVFDPVSRDNQGTGQSSRPLSPTPQRVTYNLPTSSVNFKPDDDDVDSDDLTLILLKFIKPFSNGNLGERLYNNTEYRVSAMLETRFSNKVSSAMTKQRFVERLVAVATPQPKRQRSA